MAYLSHPHHSHSQVSLDLPTSTNGIGPVGLVHLELMDEASHTLGGGMPLLLMSSDSSAAEACHLSTHDPTAQHVQSDSSATEARQLSTGKLDSSSIFLLDLACWFEAASSTAHPFQLSLGSRLLNHSIMYRLPGCITDMLRTLVHTCGVPPDRLMHCSSSTHWLHTLNPHTYESEFPWFTPFTSLTPLSAAICTGDMTTIGTLMAWAKTYRVRLNWSLPGPSGLGPLHMAALLPNCSDIMQALFSSPRPVGSDAAATWLLSRAEDGHTPSDLASTLLGGMASALDTLARDILEKAASTDSRFTPSSTLVESLQGAASGPGGHAVSEENVSTLPSTPLVEADDSDASVESVNLMALLASSFDTHCTPVSSPRPPAQTAGRDSHSTSLEETVPVSAATAVAPEKDSSCFTSPQPTLASTAMNKASSGATMNKALGAAMTNNACSGVMMPQGWGVARVLLFGFPLPEQERRYTEFKVS